MYNAARQRSLLRLARRYCHAQDAADVVQIAWVEMLRRGSRPTSMLWAVRHAAGKLPPLAVEPPEITVATTADEHCDARRILGAIGDVAALMLVDGRSALLPRQLPAYRRALREARKAVGDG